jgi:predicted alpha/beta superfamily hydrolase
VKTFELKSKATGQDYTLFVSLPKSYSDKDTTRYPVLYVLDGNFMFPVMNAFQSLLSETRETQEMIVVGIGYHTNSILGSTTFRTPDYTPTKDTAFENMLQREMNMEVKTGGANKFIQALKQDIFPFIEKRYRSKERGLAGHSFGALFGAYVVVQEPALFNKYLLSSISMFWDNQVLLQKEESFFKAGNRDLNAQLFVSVGAQEGFMDMIPGMQRFTTALRSHQYQGLAIEERVLPNEGHASAFLTAFNQGIRVLYKK